MTDANHKRKPTGTDRRTAAVAGGAPAERDANTPFRGMVGRESGVPLGIVTKNSSPPQPMTIDFTLGTGEILQCRQNKDLSLSIVKSPQQARAERWALKSVVNKIMPNSRTAGCMRLLAPIKGQLISQTQVQVHLSPEHNKAFYTGLITCGSIWPCPICASKVSERRRIELAEALEAAKALGWNVHLVTLTIPHGKGDDLATMKALQQKALAKLSNGKNSLKNRLLRNGIEQHGYIRAYEVTHGQNGWHPHYHVLLFTSGCTSQQLLSLYAPSWQKACVSVGLPMPSDKHGCTVQDGSEASRYVTKWGLEDEMTKANTKVTKRKGKTPFGLLRAVLDEDDQEYQPDYASTLFRTYAKAMKGARQLHWSVGLRQKLAMAPEISDQQLAEHVTDERSIHLANISLEQWKAIRKAKAEPHILTAAESLPPGASVILAQIINGYLEREQAKAGRGPLWGRAPDLPVSSSHNREPKLSI